MSVCSGLLLFLSFPPLTDWTCLAFVAFVPLFYLLLYVARLWQYILLCYFAMVLWNAGTIWWIVYSTAVGGVFTIFTNAVIQTLPFVPLFFCWKRHREYSGFWFILFWAAVEYGHFHWEVHFPWLTLGHIFAAHPSWVQWYEYTGVAGGTLWILGANGLVFFLLLASPPRRSIWMVVSALGVWMALPLLSSVLVHSQWKNALQKHPGDTAQIVIVQPNVDCYNSKYLTAPHEQVQALIRLSTAKITPQTRFVLWPESAIPSSYYENLPVDGRECPSPQSFVEKQMITDWLQRNPRLSLIAGMSTFRIVDVHSAREPYALRPIPRSTDTLWYIAYNTAALWADTAIVDLYHKAKLVPGVEAIPYAKYFSFMNHFVVDLGGITGALGTDSAPHCFGRQMIAPLICYESIYGDYVSSFIEKGAAALCILTNDGWWANTPGHKQHAMFGTLRAIESRRYVYRSANTGISYVADPLGNVLTRLDWDTAGAIAAPFIPLSQRTFYSRFPNLLYGLCTGGSAVYFCLILFRRWRRQPSRKAHRRQMG